MKVKNHWCHGNIIDVKIKVILGPKHRKMRMLGNRTSFDSLNVISEVAELICEDTLNIRGHNPVIGVKVV